MFELAGRLFEHDGVGHVTRVDGSDLAPFRHAHVAGAMTRARWWLLAALTPAFMLATFSVVLESGSRQLQRGSRQRLVIAEAVLRSAVQRFQYLPAVLALDSDVRALLGDPGATSRVANIDTKFEAIAQASDVAAVYLLDRRGLTLSASNWDQPLSFVGISYAYRPYFTEALAKGSSLYFGIGTTTSKPGLFISRVVAGEDGTTAGVMVVKVDLEGVQDDWRRAGERVLVSDAAGVVFLASEPEWKYRPMLPLAAPDAARIREARQYGDSTLQPLLDGALPRSGAEVGLPGRTGVVRGILERASMPDLGWTLWYLSATGPIVRQALLAALSAGIACLAVAFALAAAGQRRQRLRGEQAMRQALERRVEDRTRELSDANARLHGEIAERERATAALHATQNELIHAGRLAALGQISTAINHEINQPLAALRTFLSSSTVFLERGDTATVRRNLDRMTQVTQRIAEIIRHLKDFARRTGPEAHGTVRLRAAAEAALDLLRSRIRAESVEVSCLVPPDAAVRAEPVRLEQVLLNLMVNALDAMRDAPERRLDLTAVRDAESRWRLAVADSGGGIPEEHMARVFDPFFTTKAAGEGLGLGLSLSSLIVRDFGGSLSAANGARGAVLSLVLPAAEA